jgi:hypothetical protein
VLLLNECLFFLLSFLGSTAQLRPWPPPQNPAEFLGAFSTIFFLQGRVVSPTPNPPSRKTRPLYLYPPETGWLPILVASYDTHGLWWDYRRRGRRRRCFVINSFQKLLDTHICLLTNSSYVCTRYKIFSQEAVRQQNANIFQMRHLLFCTTRWSLPPTRGHNRTVDTAVYNLESFPTLFKHSTYQYMFQTKTTHILLMSTFYNTYSLCVRLAISVKF